MKQIWKHIKKNLYTLTNIHTHTLIYFLLALLFSPSHTTTALLLTPGTSYNTPFNNNKKKTLIIIYEQNIINDFLNLPVVCWITAKNMLN